ncbi:uncharacterized protein [Zea mays]|uniref:Uncharacterized protein n=1 Tax=Zea mays TaxID=4577 RepID=B6TFT5_MAIZE|nr:uncharacterized protein LOC100277351 [Zea mays]XP_023157629.1 uncharacterized protein LOC100277351 isoform X3 [Zea mays]ACG35968.1 hypothetical protein [Zea mays]ACG40483.1 hypothetical protein [Zea mays]|eukprot:NP_001337186.1 uncharacterized protein LOC100277351 [Zea mays]
MRARNVCVASVDLFSQNSAVATAAREDGIQCVTLLTYLAAAQIYRTNRSRHYRVMVLDNAHHSTPAGVSCSAADGVRDLDLAKASVDTDISWRTTEGELWATATYGSAVEVNNDISNLDGIEDMEAMVVDQLKMDNL